MYYSPLGIPAKFKILEVGDLVRFIYKDGFELSRFNDIRKIENIQNPGSIIIAGLSGTWNNPMRYSENWEILDVVQHKEKSPIKQKFMTIVDDIIQPLPLSEIPVNSYIINNYLIPKLCLAEGGEWSNLDNMIDAVFKNNIKFLQLPDRRITDLYEITETILQMLERKNQPIILN